MGRAAPQGPERLWFGVPLLETMLPTGKIDGVGVSCAKEAEGPRKIEPFEWSSLQLELTRNLLATPIGKRLEFPGHSKRPRLRGRLAARMRRRHDGFGPGRDIEHPSPRQGAKGRLG